MAKKLIKKPKNTPKGVGEIPTPLESQTMENKTQGVRFQARIFNGQTISIHKDENGEPWMIAKQLCDILEYQDSNSAIDQHCKGVVKKVQIDTDGGKQWMKTISEPDVYRLIMRSQMPQAVEFQDWLVNDVLPSIRRTGKYKVTRKIDYTPASPGSDSNAVAEAGEQLDLFPTYISFSLGNAAHQLRVARAKLAEQGTLFETPKAFLGYVIEKGLEAL